MARKTMAERYAAQRSRRDSRRRSLPRLSDAATALQENETEGIETDGLGDDRYPADEAVIAASRRPVRSVAPRRSSMPSRAAELTAAASAISHVDYHYVVRDLRRIAITAVGMLILLIVLNIAVQALIH